MKTQFDSNAFEHDYIIRVLQSFIVDLQTDKPQAQIIDATAVQLTAFMMGEVAAQLRIREHQKRNRVHIGNIAGLGTFPQIPKGAEAFAEWD